MTHDESMEVAEKDSMQIAFQLEVELRYGFHSEVRKMELREALRKTYDDAMRLNYVNNEIFN